MTPEQTQAADAIRSRLRAAVDRVGALVVEANAAVDRIRDRWVFDASAEQLAGATHASAVELERQRTIVARFVALPDAELLKQEVKVGQCLEVLRRAASTLSTVIDEEELTSFDAFISETASDVAQFFANAAGKVATTVGNVTAGVLDGLVSSGSGPWLLLLAWLWWSSKPKGGAAK